MRLLKRRLLLMVCGNLAMSGCGRRNAALSDFKAWLLACPIPYVSQLNDPVLARAGDVVIRESEYRSFVENIPSGSKGLSATDRRRQLDLLLRRKVQARLAQESGVLEDSDYRVSVEAVEQSILAAAWGKRFPVSEEEIRAYYHGHVRELGSRDIVVSHVAFKSPEQAQKAQALLQKGRSLPGLQRDRWSPPGPRPMDPEWVRTARALKPGEIKGPVKTQSGFEVIRRENTPPQAPPSFESTKEEIRRRLQGQKLEALIQERMSSLQVVVDENQLNAVDLPAGKQVSR